VKPKADHKVGFCIMTLQQAIPIAVPLEAPVASRVIPTVQPRYGFFVRVYRVVEWVFGLACLLVGLAMLSAVPVLQLFSLGYLLECGGRMARTGSFRAGFIGIRPAARIGGMVLMCWLFLLPIRLVADFAVSASIIDPGSTTATAWQIGFYILSALTALHLILAIAHGGKLWHFVQPLNFVFVIRDMLRGAWYTHKRDAVWDGLAQLRLPYFFLLGLKGLAVAAVWLVLPITLMVAGRWNNPLAPVVAVLGGVLLIPVLMYLPFLQLKMAAANRLATGFDVLAVRRDYRKAPWLFSLAFVVTLLFAVPLYLLKIEIVPSEAAWLPGLVFMLFIYPARLLTGWALALAHRRDAQRHWFFRWTGRLPYIPIGAAFVVIVSLTQYTSWNGVWSLYEQHAFLVPVPFLSL
jgi:hypothetical protein